MAKYGHVGSYEPLGIPSHHVEPLETADPRASEPPRRRSVLSDVLSVFSGGSKGGGKRDGDDLEEGAPLWSSGGRAEDGEDVPSGFSTRSHSRARYGTAEPSGVVIGASGLQARCRERVRCCYRDCARWQCLSAVGGGFLVFFGLLFGIVVLSLPKIGEEEIRRTDLVFREVNISNPDATGFTITADAELSKLWPTDGRLDSFEAKLLFGGEVFGSTKMPSVDAKAGVVNRLVLSSRVEVSDTLRFNLFAESLLAAAVAEMTIQGTPTVHSHLFGNVWVTVPNVVFDKTVTLTGSAGLTQSNVTYVSLADSTPEHAVVELQVDIFNPANVNILGVGSVCLDLFYNDSLSGSIQAYDASLLRGVNSLRFRGQLVDTDPVSVGILISRFLGGNATDISAGGRTCQGTTPLFRSALASLELATQLPGSSVPLVQTFDVTGLLMEPNPNKSTDVDLSMNATIVIDSVLGPNSPIVVETVAMDAALTSDNLPIGHLDVKVTAVGLTGPPQPLNYYTQQELESRYFLDEDEEATSRKLNFLDEDEEATSRKLYFLEEDEEATTKKQYFSEEDEKSTTKKQYFLDDDKKSTTKKPIILGRKFGIPPPPVSPVNVSLRIEATLHLDEGEVPFDLFVEHFLTQEYVNVGLASSNPSAVRVKLKTALGTLHVDVPILVSSPMRGVHNFKGLMDVKRFNVEGATPDGKGLAMTSDVVITNPSPVSVDLGKQAIFSVFGNATTFDIGTLLGSIYTSNFTLRPGPNPVVLRGKIEPPKNQAGLDAASALFTQYLSGSPTSIGCKGDRVIEREGEKTPEWIQKPFRNLSALTVLPGLENFTVLTDITVDAMGLRFLTDGTITTTAAISALVHVPFTNVPFSIVAVNASLTYANPLTGKPMAYIAATNQHASYSPFPTPVGPPPYPATGSIALSIPDPVQLHIIDEKAFGAFVANVVLDTTATVTVAADANETIALPIGNVQVRDLHVVESVTILAMNHTYVAVEYVDVTNALDSETLEFQAGLNITNPSPLGGSLGHVVLFLWSEGVQLGNVTIDDFALQPGLNRFDVVAKVRRPPTPAGVKVFSSFLSRYLEGIPSPISFRGSPKSSNIALLQDTFLRFESNATLPGAIGKLAVNSTLYLDKWEDGDVDARIALFNPTSHQIAVIGAKLNVYMCAKTNGNDPKICDTYGDRIGLVTNVDFSNNPIDIPPRAIIQSHILPVQLDASFGDLIDELLQLALNGDSAPAKVSGNITARVGDFVQTVDYEQLDVALHAAL